MAPGGRPGIVSPGSLGCSLSGVTGELILWPWEWFPCSGVSSSTRHCAALTSRWPMSPLQMGAGWGTSPPGEQAQLSRGRTSTPLQGSTASNLWPALCFRFDACSANGSLQGASAAALGDTRMGTLARGLPARPSGSRPSPKAQRTSGEHVCAVASGGPSVRPCLAGDGGSNPWGPRERRLGLQRRPEQEARGFEAGESSRAPRGGFCPKLVPVVIGCKAMPSAPSPHG